MKLLIIIALSLISLNVFSAEEGEQQKSPCPYADQSLERVAKETAPVEAPVEKAEDAKGISL